MMKTLLILAAVMAALGMTVMLHATTGAAPVTVMTTGLSTPDKVQKSLAAIDGVSSVSIMPKYGCVMAKLDETKIPASVFVAKVAAALAAADPKATVSAGLQIFVDTKMCSKEKKMCAGCFTEVPKTLKAVKGIAKVSLDDTGKLVTLTFAKNAKVTTNAIAKGLAASSYGFTVDFTCKRCPPTPATTGTAVKSTGDTCDCGK